MRSIHGAVCTFRRPDQLRTTLDKIASQTRLPDRLVIVDNDANPDITELVESHRICESISVDVLPAPDNPGPAGAFALAYDYLAETAAPDDILIVFDDDDPPPTDTVLFDLLDLTEEQFCDPRIGGVGLRGGILNTRTGFIERRPSTAAQLTESVDHLHGGWFPCYRFAALEAAGQFDPSFFWGFEELDLGRRVTDSGYELRVASSLYFDVAGNREERRFTTELPEPSWRHFYRHRNLIRVLRRDRAWTALAITIGVRLLVKPLIYSIHQPRLALWHIRTNRHAVIDGMRQNHLVAKSPRFLPTETGCPQTEP
jgi:GT2 family glycosyltransferase